MDKACPLGFTTVEGWSSCYRFSSTSATWPEAREHCTSLAANLLSIDTAKEANTVDYIMRAVVASRPMLALILALIVVIEMISSFKFKN